MTTTDAIVNLGQEFLAPANNWYEWRPINPELLPPGITLQGDTNYDQNVSLKLQLNQEWLNGNAERKNELTRYYIAVWGGVRRNNPEKIRSYAIAREGDLIGYGVKGIASWSKALCIRNPNLFAIYDARVAVALNSLQVIYDVENKGCFPLLGGQNKLINEASRLLKDFSDENDWQVISPADFYNRYLQICLSASIELESDLYTIEMLLFARAPNLYQQAFGNE